MAGPARHLHVHYDPDLVDDPDEPATLLADAQALIVRNPRRCGPHFSALPRSRSWWPG